MVKTRLEVGDRVLIEDLTRSNVVAITKVTDGKAIAEVMKRDGSKLDLKFQRSLTCGRVWASPLKEFGSTARVMLVN